LKRIIYLISILSLTQFSGCIIFNAVSYEVNVNDDGTGTATVFIEDINTDATTPDKIIEEANNILQHGLKSQQFIDDMKAEGKYIVLRTVEVKDEKLNAIVKYNFDDINRVEGMQYEAPYYFLTIPPTDSIISTNGQISRTKDYQRIIWDKSIKVLKFKMFGDETNGEGLTSLAKFYEKED
jgi:hypothetical protein